MRGVELDATLTGGGVIELDFHSEGSVADGCGQDVDGGEELFV